MVRFALFFLSPPVALSAGSASDGRMRFFKNGISGGISGGTSGGTGMEEKK